MVRKIRRNSLEQMCYDLENVYCNNVFVKEYNNEVTCVIDYIMSKKINENSDMLLKIKAEAEEEEPVALLAYVISALAMFFSTMSVIIEMLPSVNNHLDTVINIIFLVLIIIALIPAMVLFGKRFNSVRKWRKYILVTVNQLIENYPKEAAKQLHKGENKDKKSSNSEKIKKSKKKKSKK